jgi:hypothetical protein
MSNIEEIREMLMTDLGIDGEAAEKIMAEAPLGGDVKPGTREHEKALREYAYELIERTKYPTPLPDHPVFDLLENDEEFIEAYNAVVNRICVYLVWRFDMMGETLFARTLGCPRYEYEAARRLLEDQVELAMDADVLIVDAGTGRREICIRFRNPLIDRFQDDSETYRTESAAHFDAHHNSSTTKEDENV